VDIDAKLCLFERNLVVGHALEAPVDEAGPQEEQHPGNVAAAHGGTRDDDGAEASSSNPATHGKGDDMLDS
jgi:hypothetical protein